MFCRKSARNVSIRSGKTIRVVLRRCGDGGSQRRFVWNGEFQLPMRPAERKRRFGRVAGRIVENIAVQTGIKLPRQKFRRTSSATPRPGREITDGERLWMAAVAPIGDEITHRAMPAPGLGCGAHICQRVVMPANQRLPG